MDNLPSTRGLPSASTKASMDNFDRQKKLSLAKVDLSRKGAIDEPIFDLISTLNKSENFFTTSSCSGRIIVFDDSMESETESITQQTESVARKKGCKWLYTTHDLAEHEDVISCLSDITGDAVFKFEPFVLHVQSRSLDHAKMMLGCAVASGFRNSGISVGNKGKFIVGVRSTHSLEVPLSNQGQLLIQERYIHFLVDLANKKMKENFQRINRFSESVKEEISKDHTCKLAKDSRSDIDTIVRDPVSGVKPKQTQSHSQESRIEMDLSSSLLFDTLDGT